MRGLYHGDCLNVMKDLPERSVDLILCDLPYAAERRNINGTKRLTLRRFGKRTTAC